MIKHIVFFKLKEFKAYNERNYMLTQLKTKLEDLKDKIDVIKNIEAGINFNPSPSAFDLALTVEVENVKALTEYREHPEHKKVLEFINEIKDNAVVVDYINN